ncbi:MAG TPA: hypothetical protein PKA41_13490, partial [Verrucomicrobiota bacterium]|nr:hypothetical protein [Verrucomicrobiota bacterium]
MERNYESVAGQSIAEIAGSDAGGAAVFSLFAADGGDLPAVDRAVFEVSQGFNHETDERHESGGCKAGGWKHSTFNIQHSTFNIQHST